jgi:hypothetical protein
MGIDLFVYNAHSSINLASAVVHLEGVESFFAKDFTLTYRNNIDKYTKRWLERNKISAFVFCPNKNNRPYPNERIGGMRRASFSIILMSIKKVVLLPA